MLLALPAAVAVWSGWVGIGQLTGFGQVHPLPGIWGSLHIDSAVTLPVARGQRVFRRSLRAAGVRGSNAELGVLARLAGTSVGEPPSGPREGPIRTGPRCRA
jgi:hypothetical protein